MGSGEAFVSLGSGLGWGTDGLTKASGPPQRRKDKWKKKKITTHESKGKKGQEHRG